MIILMNILYVLAMIFFALAFIVVLITVFAGDPVGIIAALILAIPCGACSWGATTIDEHLYPTTEEVIYEQVEITHMEHNGNTYMIIGVGNTYCAEIKITLEEYALLQVGNKIPIEVIKTFKGGELQSTEYNLLGGI